MAERANKNQRSVARTRKMRARNYRIIRGLLFIIIASDRGLAGGFNILQQRTVEREMEKLSEQGKINADADQNGRLSGDDVTYILQAIAKLRTLGA